MRYDDADEITRLLVDNLESVLNDLYPGWQEVKGQALLTPQIKNGRVSSSFQMHLRGDRRGQWYRHSQKVGGHALNLVAYALTGREKGRDEYREAFQWSRNFFGLQGGRQESPEDRRERERQRERERADREKKQAAQAAQAQRKKEFKAQTSNEIAQECAPIGGTLAEKYLVSIRGLPPMNLWPNDQRENIGFHQALEYDTKEFVEYDQSGRKIKEGPRLPALVFFIRDMVGDIVALQRVFLDPETGDKITKTRPEFPQDKVQFGSLQGGACRIGGDGPRIGSQEGGETALANWALHQFRYPQWAMISTSGMIGFEPPAFVERVDIFPDGDYANRDYGDRSARDERPPPGLHAGMKQRENLHRIGVKSVLNDDTPIKGDGLDQWKVWKEHEQA